MFVVIALLVLFLAFPVFMTTFTIVLAVMALICFPFTAAEWFGEWLARLLRRWCPILMTPVSTLVRRWLKAAFD